MILALPGRAGFDRKMSFGFLTDPDPAFGTKRDDIQWTRQPVASLDLSGKRVAVIGGTGGVGRALALAMAEKGAEVLVVGRTFRDQETKNISFLACDLKSLKNARDVAQQLPAEHLDLLIMTQGIFAGRQRLTNEEGIELDMAVSCLSRRIIVHEVASRLGVLRAAAASKPRVFIMGFPGKERRATVEDFNSERTYEWFQAHLNTVVGNEALVLECAARYPSLAVFGLNPGIMKSNIMAGLLGEGSLLLALQQATIGLVFPSVEQYAQRMLPLLWSADIEQHSGAMFGRLGDAIRSNPSLQDPAYLARVIEEAEKLAQRGLA